MPIDPKCAALARHFLRQLPDEREPPEERVNALALKLQATVEEFLEEVEEVGNG